VNAPVHHMRLLDIDHATNLLSDLPEDDLAIVAAVLDSAAEAIKGSAAGKAAVRCLVESIDIFLADEDARERDAADAEVAVLEALWHLKGTV
jgi:hypothetical protein